MPPRESRKLLFHIQEAMSAIADFTAGKTGDDYLADRLLRSAVERQLEILGEELTQLSKVDVRIASRITDREVLIDLRGVNDRLIWYIVTTRLPLLRDEVYLLLNEP